MKRFIIIIFLFILISLPLKAIPTAYNDAVVHWKFDEGTGTLAADSINGNNATVNPAGWTDGQTNGGLYFNGSDAIGIADDPTIRGTGGIAISFFVKVNQWTPRQDGSGVHGASFITKGEKSGYHVEVINASSPTQGGMLRVLGFGSWDRLKYDLTPEDVQNFFTGFNHIYAYIDSSTAQLWLNGEHKDTIYFTGTEVTTTAALYMGRRSYYPHSHDLDGTMDEVAFWNRALTSQEIQEIAGVPEANSLIAMLLGCLIISGKYLFHKK